MEIIRKYFPQLSPAASNRFEQLFDIYQHWNASINLISRKDIVHLYERHVLHSLSIARIIQFSPGTKIVDVGTGGGFPGIPLSILCEDAHFTLLDSVAKKMKVVEDIIHRLHLTNCVTITARAESVKNSYDFIVARAVSSLPVFYRWIKHMAQHSTKNVMGNGIFYLKGGDLTGELKSFKKYKIYDLNQYFDEAFFTTKKLVYLPFKQ